MSRWHSYLSSASLILQQYEGHPPFHLFLRKFFSAGTKYGSKDRKFIAHLCYCYFRLGKALIKMPLEERILAGLFLCSTTKNELLDQLKPEWMDKTDLSFSDKCVFFENGYNDFSSILATIFPCTHELSKEIDTAPFFLSHFQQPDLFLRLRPGKAQTVRKKLQDAKINFRILTETCLALPNSSKIDTVIEMDKEAVVQDRSSQQTGEYFPIRKEGRSHVWDACAASGGKSIMAYDMDPTIQLTVSDTRESILYNLKKRFRLAGIRNFRSIVLDLSRPLPGGILPQKRFDLVIADVPCSGSGTWGRTPEHLMYFDENKLGEYTTLQKSIVLNTIQYIKPGGNLIYITCSVYEKENMDIVEYLLRNSSMKLESSSTLKGYNIKADTMFVALFRNPLLL